MDTQAQTAPAQPTQSKLLPKYLRVLKALEKGASVNIKGYTVIMGESPTGVPQLAIACVEPEGMLMTLDIEFNTFIRWCEGLAEVDIPIIVPKV